jgi:hypothetical protein
VAREFREREITRTEKVCTRLTCDLCGRDGNPHTDWELSSYDVNETVVKIEVFQKTGESCSDGGSGEAIQVDICPWCFRDKLIPWLESQGAKIQKRNWDW